MSYTALYRKFRPAVFEDVKGQDHIVSTLKNQIKTGRIGHAYLFCGTRGTGKTTIAKIFAKSVNCENPIEGSPCGECPSCKAIADGASMNVIEIDAASNNGVDNIREIIEEVAYSPVDGKYKVYIIDEVHMLSAGAFNALLKTLEEPPKYVIFILATTEVQKIPITVLSRCQRYDFKRISIETIADRLKELTTIEKADVEDKALKYIAKTADGSMRDALSLLDQCLAFHYGEALTYEMALNVLGSVDVTVFSQMLRLIIEDNIIGCIELLEKIVMQGRELTNFVTDFTWYLRNLMLLKSFDSADESAQDALEMSKEHFERLKEEAQMVDINTIFRYISVFSELSNKMKYSSQKRILLEMTLIKVCRPQMEIDTESILERVRALEKKLESGDFVVSAQPATAQAPVAQAPKKNVKPAAEAALPEDIDKIATGWKSLCQMVDGLMKPAMLKAERYMGPDGKLIINAATALDEKLLSQEDHQVALDEIFTQFTGKKVPFIVKGPADTAIFDSGDLVELQSRLGMSVEIE